jgi:UDP-N-acetylmuramate--alanine ligase
MRYHIVGIAGAGMSAIANLLLDQGHTVSGSDLSANRLTAALEARGARVFVGHDANNVRGADALIATAAIRGAHPELDAARTLGIPIRSRADLWQEWSQQRPVIAVAGTHGKTTTTAMIAVVLERAGLDPGFMIGGEVPDLGVNARWGAATAPLVIEADEYERVFLALRPQIAVITNIEWDHPDIYPDEASYFDTFAQFASKVADRRKLVLCGDDAGIRQALDTPEARFYGIDEELARNPASCRLAPLDWSASAVDGTGFDVWRYDRRSFGSRRMWHQELQVPGAHNVRNALAAITVAAQLGVAFEPVSAALAAFRGTARRFELKGERAGITVIDDYAHHPTETRATLAAARQRYGARRLLVYVQPHTFSRTTALLADWPDAFVDADVVLIGDIYAAREQGDKAGLARTLAERITASGKQAEAGGDLAAATARLAELAQAGDVVLTLGAGDGYLVGEQLLAMMDG